MQLVAARTWGEAEIIDARRNVTARAAKRLVLLALAVTTALASVAPSTVAGTGDVPMIAVVNPIRATQIRVVADKPHANSSGYRFVASTRHASTEEYRVDFVIKSAAHSFRMSTSGGPDGYWGAAWSVPEDFPDGRYMLRAELIHLDGMVVDSDSVSIDVTGSNNGGVPPAETLWIGPPIGEEGLGMYAPPGGRPTAKIFTYVSEGTEQVRTFYSKTRPGARPRWIACGRARVQPADAYTDRSATIGCRLARGDRPLDLKLVAAVPNETSPPAPPDPERDGSSTVMRASFYRARPDGLYLTLASNESYGDCMAAGGFAVDQHGNSLWHANVDIHLTSKSGKVSFASGSRTTRVKAPDRHHSKAITAGLCDRSIRPGTQAKHARDGSRMHAELWNYGTDTTGNFTVAATTTDAPTTQMMGWIDQNNDDVRQRSEPWDIFLFREDTSIRVVPDKKTVEPGGTVSLWGALDGAHYCNDYRGVALQARSSDVLPWEDVASGKFDMWGTVTFSRQVTSPTWFRMRSAAVHGTCQEATSRPVFIDIN